MRAARVFRWIMRIFILLLTLSLSVVSILGALSAVNIFSESNNVQIPDGSVTINLPSNITVPFRITNAGYFDLNNLVIGFELEMTYNVTLTQIIYNDHQEFGNILHGTTLARNYTLSEFTLPPGIFTGPSFEANITITGSYSLDLISFEIHLTDIAIA